VRFEKTWVEQCRATKAIERNTGTALGEALMHGDGNFVVYDGRRCG
jgi:hypothetical protein